MKKDLEALLGHVLLNRPSLCDKNLHDGVYLIVYPDTYKCVQCDSVVTLNQELFHKLYTPFKHAEHYYTLKSVIKKIIMDCEEQ